MPKRHLKEATRDLDYVCDSLAGTLTVNEIQTGCLMRIADAAELMAKDHQRAINDRDMYKRWYQDERARHTLTQRSNAALRGVITKMKKKEGINNG